MLFRGKSPNGYKIPNRKKKLITNEFLRTLREEIDINIDESVVNIKTYWGLYLHVELTNEFKEALRETCKKHNVESSIYKYYLKLSDSELEYFEDSLVILMIDNGIIEEGNVYDGIPDYDSEELESFEYVNKVTEHNNKGYKVITSEWTIKEKGIIENILNE